MGSRDSYAVDPQDPCAPPQRLCHGGQNRRANTIAARGQTIVCRTGPVQYTVWQYSAGEDLEDRILENGLETFLSPQRKNRDVGCEFCSKCGVAFARQCPRCGASNEPGEDFLWN